LKGWCYALSFVIGRQDIQKGITGAATFIPGLNPTRCKSFFMFVSTFLTSNRVGEHMVKSNCLDQVGVHILKSIFLDLVDVKVNNEWYFRN
jgi:hypothetical protein